MKGFMYYAAFLVITVLYSNLVGAASNHWSYQNEDKWPAKCLYGKKQSPINLQKDTAEHLSFTDFQFRRYDLKYDASVKNTGHSVSVKLNYPQPGPSVKGGGFPHEYVLDHLHFHWESEHTLHSNRFPLELHFVHYANIFNSTGSALQNSDFNNNGLAVLGVLFDFREEDNPAFEQILKKLYEIKDFVGKEVDLERESIIPSDFLPKNTESFFRYEGSLTTPGCNEAVLWTVFYQHSFISKRQFADFQTINADEGPIIANYRSLQNLNGRVVVYRNAAYINTLNYSCVIAFIIFYAYILRNNISF